MIKKLAVYIVVFSVVFAISYSLQQFWLNNSLDQQRLPLHSIYWFHFIASLFICMVFAFLAKTKKWQQQLGFVYMFSFVTKLMLFALVFQKTIFQLENLSKFESLNLLIPVFIFLFLEVFFLSKILSATQA